MKQIFLSIIIIFSFNSIKAQEVSSASSYRCKNGFVVKKGATIKLGIPSGESFYEISDKITSKNNKKQLPRLYKDSVFTIEGITKYKWEEGYRETMITIKLDGDKYYFNIEKAISSGEVALPEGYDRGGGRSMEEDLRADKARFERLADSVPLKDGKIFYDRIVDAKGMKKEELFVQLRQWLVEEFVDSKSVLEVNDKEGGLLTGKGTYKYLETKGLTVQSGYVRFIINIAAKDDKFRYQLYSFTAKGNKDDYWWGTSVPESFDLDEMLGKYQAGTGGSKKQAKKYIVKMAWLADYIDWSLSKIASKKYNNISDF